MADQEIRTFKDIQDAIIRRAKLKDSTVVRNDLKEKINTAYQKIAFHKFYRWSGKTRAISLKGQYTTGTIAVTKGSHAITGTSTVWTELLHQEWKMKIGSQPGPYTIKRVASNTSAIIEPAFEGDTASLVNYVLYKDEYGMFPDFHEIRKFYIPGTVKRITPEGPDKLDELRFNRPFYGGTPQIYTVNSRAVYHQKKWDDFVLNTDFWEDEVTASPRNENLIFYPSIFTNDKIGYIRYTVIPRPLSGDDDEPLMPYANRPILVYGPLVEIFLQRRDTQFKKEWEKKHKDYLKDMEGDVESVDDALIFAVDRRPNRRSRILENFSDDCST